MIFFSITFKESDFKLIQVGIKKQDIMKRAITLWVLMIFTGTFTYGQRTSHLDHYRSLENRSEKQAFDQLQNYKNIFPKFLLKQKQKNSLYLHQKSSHAYTHRLDSIKINVFAGGVDLPSKNIFIYDADGKNTKYINSANGNPVSKDEYTYNAGGYLSEDVSFYWDDSMSQWLYTWKSEKSYDTNGYLTQEIISNYDQFSSKWINDSKYETTYNTHGFTIKEISSNWDVVSGKWIPQSKYEYTYDLNGNEITYLTYHWDVVQSKWINGLKVESTYDTSGYPMHSVAFNWNQNSWEKDWKDEYTFDAAGYILSDIYSDWDTFINNWRSISKDTYVYDADNNLSEGIDYQWDDAGKVWKKNLKNTYTYDKTYSSSEILFPVLIQDLGDLSSNMLTERKAYNWQENKDKWEITMDQLFYYSKQTKLSADRFDIPGLKIYPNPVPLGSELRIDSEAPIEKVTIFSLLGQKLKEVNDPAGNIDLAGLSRGIYMIKIFSDKGSTARKLIKE